MICDYLPTPALLDLLARAERGLGVVNAEVENSLLAAERAAGGQA
jgi:hypothetical protein